MVTYKRILCPIDFSESSLAALDAVAEMAATFETSVRVLHVIPLMPAGTEIAPIADYNQLRAETLAQLHTIVAERMHLNQHIRYEVDVRFGDAAEEIVAAALGDAELIVISTHGRAGWRDLVFGSVAERVVRTASCRVLTVRAAPHPVTGGSRREFAGAQ
jgi:nucleotide-binding universal stress UspA family protein